MNDMFESSLPFRQRGLASVASVDAKHAIAKKRATAECHRLESSPAAAEVNKDDILCIRDLERHAQAQLPRMALDYYRSGADECLTLGENKAAFRRLRLRPRFMVDVSKRSMTARVLGSSISMPIGIAPTALQRMAHPDGECASAKAAEEMGTVFVLSTIATSSVEQVAKAAPNCNKWLQLYIYKDRTVTEGLVRRAEAAGFTAIAVTVDAPYFGRRLADIKNKFALPSHLRMENFSLLDTDSEETTRANRSEGGSGINEYVASLFDQSLTWDDLRWLKQFTKLPIVAKGILTAEDAELALSAGADAIWVSNHGARQLDTVPASIEALPSIVKAVGNRCEIYLDGGVTQGTDVLKALALGASMVFVGRPVIWGLACGGKDGVKGALSILQKELDLAMALSGCPTLTAVNRNLVKHAGEFCKL